LIARGFGESDPAILLDASKKPVLNDKGEKIKLTEKYIDSQHNKDLENELHQKNRRTAFKVVGEGFVLESKG
jgi:hypothetical protein